jgi:aspartate carbamoyltransferase regulatory subunit
MKKEHSVSKIKDGTVIDHIPSKSTLKVVNILNLEKHRNIISIGTNLHSKVMGKKGIVKIGGKTLTQEEVDKVAIIAPYVTVNLIKDYEVKKKLKVSVPDEVENIIKCSNPNCITNHEKADTKFKVLKKKPVKVMCKYCERVMEKEDIKLV